MTESLNALGANAKQIKAWNEKCRNPSPLPIAKENWTALSLFIAAATQWRSCEGCLTGLDYLALETTARICAIPLDRETFRKIQILEQTTIEIIHRRRQDADTESR